MKTIHLFFYGEEKEALFPSTKFFEIIAVIALMHKL